MNLTIDHDMACVARALWPSPQRMEPASGGLFNRVLRVQSAAGITYLKRFTDAAASGDFPPLPTSAAQRCLVAASWHDLALRASAIDARVAVPPLLAVQTGLDLVAMEQAHGEPLYDSLIRGDRSTLQALTKTAAWLAVLHGLPLEPRDRLLASSHAFKAFKIDLQYTRVLPEVPAALHQTAHRFIDHYLALHAEPVHGDLNSRNILCTNDSVSVIDFEQGHFGEGLYDLAYLLSEYVIHQLREGGDPETAVSAAWDAYRSARVLPDEDAAWRRLRVHLAFQTLYRLVGPSRKVWTGHLDAASQHAVRQWSVDEMHTWLA